MRSTSDLSERYAPGDLDPTPRLVVSTASDEGEPGLLPTGQRGPTVRRQSWARSRHLRRRRQLRRRAHVRAPPRARSRGRDRVRGPRGERGLDPARRPRARLAAGPLELAQDVVGVPAGPVLVPVPELALVLAVGLLRLAQEPRPASSSAHPAPRPPSCVGAVAAIRSTGCQVGDCGLKWGEVADLEGVAPCFSVSTSTQSTTRTVSPSRAVSSILRRGRRQSARHRRVPRRVHAAAETAMASRLADLDPLRVRPASFCRAMFSSGSEADLDKQARDHPRRPAQEASPTRDVVVVGVGDHPEVWDRKAWQDEIEDVEGRGWSCCGTRCGTRALITSWSSPTRCASSSRSSPGDGHRRDFGAGGHAALLAADLQGKGRSIAIDKDASVRPYFERFQRGTSVSARFLRGDFAVILGQLADNGVEADAIHLDLGISSMQVDRPERGFSHAADAPLDMRMDASAPRSARRRQRSGRARAARTSSPLRRGALLAPDRPAIVHAVPSSRSNGPAISSRSSAPPSPRRGASGTATRRSAFSGAAHRGQRRARVARTGASRGSAAPAPGRPDRGHQLPLPRGQDRQALLRGPGPRVHALQISRFAFAAAAVPAPGDAQGIRPRRPMAENPRASSARLRGGEDLMATAAARAEPRPRRAPRPQPRPSAKPRQAPRKRAAARPHLAGSVVGSSSWPRCSPGSSRSTSASCG